MQVYFRLVALFLFFSYCQVSISQEIYDGQDFLDKGNQLLSDKKHKEAFSYFQKVDSLDPLYCQSIYYTTKMYFDLDSLDKALEYGLKSKKEGCFQEFPRNYVILADIYSNQKNYEKSMEIVEEGIKLFPDYALLYYKKSLLFYQTGKMQEAMDEIVRCITLNPNLVRGYYLAGVIALENGHIAEGSIYLMYYLAANPNDEYADEAIASLNKKMSQNYLEKKPIQFSKNGDDFSELEMILRNEFPLDKDFKLVVSIDDIYTRQAQAILDYLSTHQSKGGFIESYIAPVLADIYKKGYTDAFIYYTMESLGPDLGKMYTSKIKLISKFNEEYISKDFWNLFALRPMLHDGKMQDVLCFINEDYPSQRGAIKNGINQGKWVQLSPYGKIIGTLHFIDGKEQGEVQFFNEKGILIEKIMAKDGVKSGDHASFYSNGNKKDVDFYTNNKYDNKATTYHFGGGKDCELTYKDGILEGPLNCWYQNGEKYSEEIMKNGKYDGLNKYYYEDGTLKETKIYEEGVLAGENIFYNRDGSINHKIEFKDNVIVNNFETKDDLGRLKLQYELDGKVVTRSFYEAGILSSKMVSDNIIYEDKSITVYDNNIPNYQLIFDGKKLKEAIQYTYDNPKGVTKKGGTIELTNLYGNPLLKISNTNDFPNRTVTNYLANGKPQSVFVFKDGNIEGDIKIYNQNGQLEESYFISNNEIEGKYDSYYYEGPLKSTYHYKDGLLQGPFTVYHTNGKVSQKGFFNEDTKYGTVYYYSLNGNIMSTETYVDGNIEKIAHYDTNEKLITELNLASLNGIHEFFYYGGKEKFIVNYTNGVWNGKMALLLGKDTLQVSQYVNDLRDGKLKVFNGFGKLYQEGTYNLGKNTNITHYYNQLGLLRHTSTSEGGNENGESVGYLPSGKIYWREFNTNNQTVGAIAYLDEMGDTLALLHKFEEVIVDVTIKKNGSLINQAYSVNGKNDYTVTDDTGKKAMSFSIEEGYITELDLYNHQGLRQIFYKKNNNLLEGNRTFYYSDGTLAIDENFVNGEFQGISKYYNQDGSLKYEFTYQNDYLHGPSSEYSNGKKIKTLIYDTDIVVDIQIH